MFFLHLQGRVTAGSGCTRIFTPTGLGSLDCTLYFVMPKGGLFILPYPPTSLPLVPDSLINNSAWNGSSHWVTNLEIKIGYSGHKALGLTNQCVCKGEYLKGSV